MSRTLSGRGVSSLACPVGTSSSLLASLYASSHSPVRGPGSGPRRIARSVIPPPAFPMMCSMQNSSPAHNASEPPHPSVAAPTNRAGPVRNFRE
jgi:hypothetical protein